MNKENQLWRNYMDHMDSTNLSETKWLKEVKLDTPFPCESHAAYMEKEFEDLLLTDKEFREKWGQL